MSFARINIKYYDKYTIFLKTQNGRSKKKIYFFIFISLHCFELFRFECDLKICYLWWQIFVFSRLITYSDETVPIHRDAIFASVLDMKWCALHVTKYRIASSGATTCVHFLMYVYEFFLRWFSSLRVDFLFSDE